jgi:hypothetical protein
MGSLCWFAWVLGYADTQFKGDRVEFDHGSSLCVGEIAMGLRIWVNSWRGAGGGEIRPGWISGFCIPWHPTRSLRVRSATTCSW